MGSSTTDPRWYGSNVGCSNLQTSVSGNNVETRSTHIFNIYHTDNGNTSKLPFNFDYTHRIQKWNPDTSNWDNVNHFDNLPNAGWNVRHNDHKDHHDAEDHRDHWYYHRSVDANLEVGLYRVFAYTRLDCRYVKDGHPQAEQEPLYAERTKEFNIK